MTRKKVQQRARKSEDKAARREQILDHSLDLFQQQEIESISIAEIAKRAGLAKGTLYLYFQTKEEVFLGVMHRLLAAWIEEVELQFSKIKKNLSPIQFTRVFVGTLKNQPGLPRLLSQLHLILERNISGEAAFDFKLDLKNALTKMATVVEHKTDCLQGPATLSFLLKSYGMLVGLYQICNPPEQIQEILAHPDLALFQMDFHEQLEQGLVLLLLGLEKIESENSNSYHFFGNY